MNVEITRYALDQVPLSIIFDDSTLLINLNYFWMRNHNLVDGENRCWQDVPVVHPESFTRQFAEWYLEKAYAEIQHGSFSCRYWKNLTRDCDSLAKLNRKVG